MALPISKADMSDMLELLTHKGKEGTGYFDVLMRSISSQLQDEFEAQRISPAEYAQTYAELTSSALSGAISYLVQAPAALEQGNLVAAQVEIAKAELALKEKELEIREQELLQAQKQNLLIDAQIANMTADTAQKQQTTANLVEQGKALVFETVSAEQKSLAMEYRAWAEYAVTNDLMPDGTAVGGTVAKDNAVKQAQATAFKAKDLYQMINMNQSSNTAQITTLGDVSIAPTVTTGASIDNAVQAYYSLIGVTV